RNEVIWTGMAKEGRQVSARELFDAIQGSRWARIAAVEGNIVVEYSGDVSAELRMRLREQLQQHKAELLRLLRSAYQQNTSPHTRLRVRGKENTSATRQNSTPYAREEKRKTSAKDGRRLTPKQEAFLRYRTTPPYCSS